MRIAAIRRHATGQWMVKLSGKCYYLGTDKIEAQRKYRELIVEHYGPSKVITSGASGTPSVTVEKLINDFIAHRLQTCDPKYKTITEENYKQVKRHLLELYSNLLAEDFGPKAYKTVREQMAAVKGRNYGYINKLCSRMKAAWKWGVSEELVSESSYRRLCTVPDLQAGELGLPDVREVLPVDRKLFDATLPYLSETMADLVRLLWLTGARPSELVGLTPAEIMKDGDHMVYRPKSHKTKKRNKLRAIVFGEESVVILKKYWPKKDHERFFSMYSSSGVIRKAIARACVRANLPKWHPYQIRHAALTRIVIEHGKDVAKAVGGHAKAITTDRYDHAAVELAKRAAG